MINVFDSPEYLLWLKEKRPKGIDETQSGTVRNTRPKKLTDDPSHEEKLELLLEGIEHQLERIADALEDKNRTEHVYEQE